MDNNQPDHGGGQPSDYDDKGDAADQPRQVGPSIANYDANRPGHYPQPRDEDLLAAFQKGQELVQQLAKEVNALHSARAQHAVAD